MKVEFLNKNSIELIAENNLERDFLEQLNLKNLFISSQEYQLGRLISIGILFMKEAKLTTEKALISERLP